MEECKHCGAEHAEDAFGMCDECGEETCPSCRADVADVHIGCAD